MMLAKLRSGSAGGGSRHGVVIHTGRHIYVSAMNLEDGFPAQEVGQFHGYAAVKAAGTEQSLVQRFWTVGGRQNHHTLAGIEAIHFSKKLIERLLPLIVAPHPQSIVTLLANGVDLIDEYDTGRFLLGLFE